MKKLIYSLIIAFVTSNCFSQANLAGSGNCLSFNGTSDYVGVVNSPFLNPSSITLEIWVYFNSFGTSGGMIIDKDNPEWGPYYLYYSSAGQLYMAFGRATPLTWEGANFSIPLTIASWQHIVATYDAANGEVRGYKDGILIGTDITTWAGGGALRSNNNQLTFGRQNQVLRYFNGQIDEVRIWNRALTETEIRENMCKKLTGNESGLVGYWRFDESSGNTAFDSSTNANNGTLKP